MRKIIALLLFCALSSAHPTTISPTQDTENDSEKSRKIIGQR